MIQAMLFFTLWIFLGSWRFPLNSNKLKNNIKHAVLQHTCARSTRGVRSCPEVVGVAGASESRSGLWVAVERTFSAKLPSSQWFVGAHLTGWNNMEKGHVTSTKFVRNSVNQSLSIKLNKGNAIWGYSFRSHALVLSVRVSSGFI